MKFKKTFFIVMALIFSVVPFNTLTHTAYGAPGISVLVSADSSGNSSNSGSYGSKQQASYDGEFVVFTSGATNLIAGDTNNKTDVFVKTVASGAIERISVSTGGTQSDNHSSTAVISPNGKIVAFASSATNLVAGDTNGVQDIFVRDLVNDTTQLISKSSGGTLGNNVSTIRSISQDGRFVGYDSYATNLVTGDTNGLADSFVWDNLYGTTSRVNVSSGGTEANNTAGGPSLSCEGTVLTFDALATNLVAGDTNGVQDIIVVDRVSDTIQNITISANGHSGNPTMSCDGRYITFVSGATNLVAGDTNAVDDIFIFDRYSSTFERISVSTAEAEGNANSNTTSDVSADGRYVVFTSDATNLVSGDTNAKTDAFLRDRTSGTTEILTNDQWGLPSNNNSFQVTISGNNQYAAFTSGAGDLVSGDGNGQDDVFRVATGIATPFCGR